MSVFGREQVLKNYAKHAWFKKYYKQLILRCFLEKLRNINAKRLQHNDINNCCHVQGKIAMAAIANRLLPIAFLLSTFAPLYESKIT